VKKQIVFLTNQLGVQGSFLNHLDLQQYLKDRENYDVKFYCESIKNLFSVIRDSRREYTFDKNELFKVADEVVEPEVVITDFKSLLTLSQSGIFVICKKLIVMDSVELTYHLKNVTNARFYYEVNMEKVLRSYYCDDIVFLMPPNNYYLFREKYPDLHCEIFFKKINTDVLSTMKFENRDGYFCRWDDNKDYKRLVAEKFGDNVFCFEPEWKMRKGMKIPLKYNEIDHIFDYKSFIYRRRKYLEYQEQFGRLVFEYILLGKTVYFMDEPFQDDCLTDYLKYYKIKFDHNNKITTTAEELRDKMRRYEYEPWNL